MCTNYYILKKKLLQQLEDVLAAGELAGGDELRECARERRTMDAEEVFRRAVRT